MCGLVAVLQLNTRGFNNNQLNVVMAQLFINQWRGLDSTGVVGISNKGLDYIAKEVGGPNELFASKQWDKWHRDMFKDGQLMFGHGRAATRGDISAENAHPFTEFMVDGENFIDLVHNGTLHSYQTLPGLKDYKVDSQWLTHCVASYGAEETFQKVDGPIATIWWNSKDQTINFYRNDERPLFLAHDKVSGEIYVNSEISALMWLKYHYNLHFERDDLRSFTARKLYTMRFDEIAKGWTTTEIKPKPVIIYPPHTGHRIQGPYYGLGYDDSEDEDAWKTENNTGGPVKETPGETRHWPAVVNDSKDFIPANQWHTMARSFDIDCKYLLEGKIKRVAWINNERQTVMPHGEFRTNFAKPYNNYLKSMYLTDKDSVWCNYAQGTSTTWHQIITRAELLKMNDDDDGETIDTPNKDFDTYALNTDFKMGDRKKFKTKLPDGKTVKHWANVGNIHSRHFTEYFNPVDGKFQIGDKIQIEMYDWQDFFEKTDQKFTMVRGARPKPAGSDKYVDFYFFEKLLTKEQMQKDVFMEGEIHTIRLATREEFNENGSIVRIMLDKVQPLTAVQVMTSLLTNEVNPNAA